MPEKQSKSKSFSERLFEAYHVIKNSDLKSDGNNPYYNSKYSTLNNYNQVVDPPLAKLRIYQNFKFCTMQEGTSILKLIVSDAFSEEKRETCIMLPEYKKDIHSLGSEVTYLKRILLCGFWNLSVNEDETDNDGNTAMLNTTVKKQEKPEAAKTEKKEFETNEPSQDKWFKDKYMNKIQELCEQYKISKEQLFERLKSRYKTSRGTPIVTLEDATFIKKENKEKLRADILTGFMDVSSAIDEADLTGEKGEDEFDDIPF